MKVIFLNRGQTALVDDEDYERLMKYNWKEAKTRRGNFYVVCSENKKRILMHRFIANCPHEMEVDHIDGDTLNNQKKNLRICDRFGNSRNSNKMKRKNITSKYKGVSKMYDLFFNKKYKASIYFNKRSYWAYFNDEKEAALWYDRMAIKLYGEFAKTNKMLGLLD